MAHPDIIHKPSAYDYLIAIAKFNSNASSMFQYLIDNNIVRLKLYKLIYRWYEYDLNAFISAIDMCIKCETPNPHGVWEELVKRSPRSVRMNTERIRKRNAKLET